MECVAIVRVQEDSLLVAPLALLPDALFVLVHQARFVSVYVAQVDEQGIETVLLERVLGVGDHPDQILVVLDSLVDGLEKRLNGFAARILEMRPLLAIQTVETIGPQVQVDSIFQERFRAPLEDIEGERCDSATLPNT